MKQMVIISCKLALICAVAASALGLINSVTAPQIERIKKENLDKALAGLIREGSIGEEVLVSKDDKEGIKGYFPVTDSNNNCTGYILKINGTGYGGVMEIIASYETSGVIINAVLMKNEETPGLGKKAENPEYMNKYIGTGGDTPVPVRKNMLGGGESKKTEKKSSSGIFEWFFGESDKSDAVASATTSDIVGPEGSSPDAVSGATITFAGIGRALEAGSEYVKNNPEGSR